MQHDQSEFIGQCGTGSRLSVDASTIVFREDIADFAVDLSIDKSVLR